METTRVSVGGEQIPVVVGGPETTHTVMLLGDTGHEPDSFTTVCERLHNSALRTIVPQDPAALDRTTLMGLLDALEIGWVNLVGIDGGAELAWAVAATQFGRFASLVVADRGHPAVPDRGGLVRDAACPPVELPTTVLVSQPDRAPEARGSGRFVYADFRMVELAPVAQVPRDAAAELATEITLRTSPW
ncbi:alpha/beta hydrolase [Rhodococcus rhodnii]|uniref:Alpha/beta hydrolase n=2 Tax=Rhodococcus rhodnii TaxID=38312 RepID=R7WL46_9NOCA|nr:hypothetical protein [Rhodococcus rhodnii]EOM76023.1 hypothetical protein Rrhod_2671 [Rhodococcus rhodnii LMG 5362]TXG90860.1 alpha/beta hydrolase [Rhodococcus rhodnii]